MSTADEKRGLVFDIKRFAVHDGPGIRTTAFLKGCPLSCRWCQNPEGIPGKVQLWYHSQRCIRCGTCLESCPNTALTGDDDSSVFIKVDRGACTLSGECLTVCPTTALEFDSREYSSSELADVLCRDSVFYETSGGGITLSGGEPLLQADFALEVLKLCRERGAHTTVETTLHIRRSVVERFLPLVDLFLTDVKLMDDANHHKYTGVGNSLIHDNVKWLAEKEAAMMVRIPLIPGITATETNVRAVARFVCSLPGEVPLELINFNPLASGKYRALGLHYDFAKVTSPLENSVVESLAQAARQEGAKVVG